jgi:hypothetical protein
MLRTKLVKGRLVDLLRRAAERGVRTTFRELLAYVSFLIYGGKTCVELLADPLSEQNRYYWLAFEAQGIISETLCRGIDPVQQTEPNIDEQLWRGAIVPEDFAGHQILSLTARDLDELSEKDGRDASDFFVALKRRWYFEHPDGRLGHALQADRLFRELQDRSLSIQLRVGRLIGLINAWWNHTDESQEEQLRLWTRLSYSPRAHGRAMVSGTEVSSLRLGLFKPQLSAPLRAAFGELASDYLILAPPDNMRFASLRIDRRLIMTLLYGGITEQDQEIERRLIQFNDALAQHADKGARVRTIEMLDPESELTVKVRVDLQRRRYDSAQ